MGGSRATGSGARYLTPFGALTYTFDNSNITGAANQTAFGVATRCWNVASERGATGFVVVVMVSSSDGVS